MKNPGHEHRMGRWQSLQIAPFDWARQLRSHWIAILILVARLGLGTIYSVVVPIWEASDEDGHYQYARYIATKRALPQRGDPEAEAIPMKKHPPLYHVLAAASMSWIDVSDDLKPTLNPYMSWGDAGINYAIHPDWEGFPYKGTVLAVHVIRFLSAAIGTIGVLLTYLIGLMIAPQRRWIAVGAMAVHAFWPQFLFHSSVVTNDVLAATMGSLVTLLLIWIVQRGARGLQLIAVGISLGLSLLSKLNTIALFPIAITVVLGETIRRLRDPHGRKEWEWWVFLILSFLPLVLAYRVLTDLSFVNIPAIWYFERTSSWSRGVQRLVSTPKVLSWSIGDALRYGAKTFYAVFGWGNLEVAASLYRANALLVALALVGLVAVLVRGQRVVSRTALLLCTAVVLTMLVLVLAAAARTGHLFYAHGRYLLPAMSALSLLLFTGWFALCPIRAGKPLALIATAVMFMIAVVLPFDLIIPAYARPPVLSSADVQDLEYHLSFNFDHKMELLGYELNKNELNPGQGVKVTLYWRALSEMDRDYTICVHLMGSNGESYPADCTYPGRGNYATSLWKRDDIVRDKYHVGIPRDFPTPGFARVYVAVLRYPEEEYLSVIDPQGRATSESATFGRLKVARDEEFIPDTTNAMRYTLRDTIAFVGYELSGTPSPGNTLQVKLYWKSLTSTDKDYTVFVHCVDRDGRLWAQHDGQPRNNTYPTSLWDEGEIIEDEHELTLPADIRSGSYQIRVGMYLLDTMQRLSVLDDQGHRERADEIILKEMLVAP